MDCVNLRDPKDRISFGAAVQVGLGANGGLYLPAEWPPLPSALLDEWLALPRPERLAAFATHFLGEEFGGDEAAGIPRAALDFPVPLVALEPGVRVLELFHGPTLAFKDVGARFMARAMATRRARLTSMGIHPTSRVTILTATSGDTGSAVADAFHDVPGIDVVILYPAGRITRVQEMQMITLGDNIHALAVTGDFDDCQRLVKGAFQDPELRRTAGLTTANSMNMGRLLPQVTYYFDAVAELRAAGIAEPPLISVPSGNFGNLTAGVMAARLGLPVAGFVAATNENDTVPRYLAGGAYAPAATVETPSSAMDVAAPNNWPRIEALGGDRAALAALITGERVDTAETLATIRAVAERTGYTLDPHAAVGYAALARVRARRTTPPPGIVLATAHPAKFNDVMERALGRPVPLPERLAACLMRKPRGGQLAATPDALSEYLRFLRPGARHDG